MNVLIVDDAVETRGVIRMCVEDAVGHCETVWEAGDGFEALSMARRMNPDVVIMDKFLPALDGIEASRLISEYVPTSRVIVFTAHLEVDDVARAGAVAAFGKDNLEAMLEYLAS